MQMWGISKNMKLACRSEENASGFFDSETENNNALKKIEVIYEIDLQRRG